ncbi:hypothetical protein L4C33_21215, partial [Vibrio makurazakiensis]|uniref:hypothetical protein n=1 Tax=Vibrio makurazakiensis TaxID=2910250 RepID=UPI003D11A6BB
MKHVRGADNPPFQKLIQALFGTKNAHQKPQSSEKLTHQYSFITKVVVFHMKIHCSTFVNFNLTLKKQEDSKMITVN